MAQKSAEAARNTTALIEEAIAAISTGHDIAKTTESSLNGLIDNVKLVADQIDLITTQSEVQTQSITNISVGRDEILEEIKANMRTSQQTSEISDNLLNEAQVLKDLMNKLSGEN